MSDSKQAKREADAYFQGGQDRESVLAPIIERLRANVSNLKTTIKTLHSTCESYELRLMAAQENQGVLTAKNALLKEQLNDAIDLLDGAVIRCTEDSDSQYPAENADHVEALIEIRDNPKCDPAAIASAALIRIPIGVKNDQ